MRILRAQAIASIGGRSIFLIVLCGALFGHVARAQFFDPDAAWSAPGTFYGQWSRSVSGVGDVNGDGFDDVLLGGPFYFTPCCPSSNQQGGVLLYYGAASGLSASHDWVEIGSFPGTTLGYRVAAAGDVNGDGFDELLFNSGSGFGDGTHQVHVRYGSSTGPSGAWDFDDGSMYGALGPAVDGGADVNGDGFDDIIAGFSRAGGVGIVRVFHGSALGLPVAPDWEQSGETTNQRFGHFVTFAGDVNGDGFDDALVADDPTGTDLSSIELYYPGFPRCPMRFYALDTALS
ncbi:MAG: hypothetical protein GY716_23000, partial [bacterium]|nr:hypothetical protein [bacterium]